MFATAKTDMSLVLMNSAGDTLSRSLRENFISIVSLVIYVPFTLQGILVFETFWLLINPIAVDSHELKPLC